MDVMPTDNRTYAEIAPGDSASLVRTLTRDDIELFAIVSGDTNPSHLDPAYAMGAAHGIVAHGMWGGALVSAVLGTRLPGPGTVYVSQDLQFQAPIAAGDTITTTVTARDKRPGGQVAFDCACVNQAGTAVITGTAVVVAPAERLSGTLAELPDIRLGRHRQFRDLLAQLALPSRLAR
ncbi:MAG: MaoC family dehydratase N-terminal domain-containing protein, partial [Gemmatimonadaceae bacterium]|nr:MaoC family dehydratase N-terminal domain-containing protein [Acetobacteraceae bacterium]